MSAHLVWLPESERDHLTVMDLPRDQPIQMMGPAPSLAWAMTGREDYRDPPRYWMRPQRFRVIGREFRVLAREGLEPTPRDVVYALIDMDPGDVRAIEVTR